MEKKKQQQHVPALYLNVVKKPVKIQFFERFHWRNESKANEGTKARHFSFP